MARRAPPAELSRVLWDLDADALDVVTDAESIIPRVLEYGCLAELEVLIDLYGLERIHDSLRVAAHPLVSERTRAFWRAFFRVRDEVWNSPPSWRRSNAAPWID